MKARVEATAAEKARLQAEAGAVEKARAEAAAAKKARLEAEAAEHVSHIVLSDTDGISRNGDTQRSAYVVGASYPNSRSFLQYITTTQSTSTAPLSSPPISMRDT